MKTKAPNLRPVLVFGSCPRLLYAAGLEYDIRPGQEWSEMVSLLRCSPPSTVVVVDPYAGRRPGEAFPHIRDMLRRFPSVPVIATLPLSHENTVDFATLLGWGVSGVIVLGRGEETAQAMRARLREVHARPFKRQLVRWMSPFVRGDAMLVLMAAAEVVVEGGHAPDLAWRLRVSCRTMTERCMRADLPPPRQIQAWMRILLACVLLDDPGRTVYSVAYACGYATDRSLRRAIRTFLDMDTTYLRRVGAFAAAADRFNAQLRELREKGRERRKEEREGTA